MPLNDIQKLCTGAPEFVVGEIYGLRQWFDVVDPFSGYGPTTGLVGHNNMSWTPGQVHTATCNRKAENLTQHLTLVGDYDPDPNRRIELLVDEIYQYIGNFFDADPDIHAVDIHVGSPDPEAGEAARDEYKSSQELRNVLYRRVSAVRDAKPWAPIQVSLFALQQIPEHRVTDPTCTCGFYAYTDAAALYDNSANYSFVPSVFGIVKAYGLVTQGTRGFRAEKAEIVSLTMPLSFRDREEEEIYSWRSSTSLFVSAPRWTPNTDVPVRFPGHTKHATLESLLDSYRGPDERPAL